MKMTKTKHIEESLLLEGIFDVKVWCPSLWKEEFPASLHWKTKCNLDESFRLVRDRYGKTKYVQFDVSVKVNDKDTLEILSEKNFFIYRYNVILVKTVLTSLENAISVVSYSDIRPLTHNCAPFDKSETTITHAASQYGMKISLDEKTEKETSS